MLLLIGIGGFFLYLFFYTVKHILKRSSLEEPHHEGTDTGSISMFTNSCYQTRSSLLVRELPELDLTTMHSQIYSEIGNDRDSDQYDDIIVNNNHYDVIPEDVRSSCAHEEESIMQQRWAKCSNRKRGFTQLPDMLCQMRVKTCSYWPGETVKVALSIREGNKYVYGMEELNAYNNFFCTGCVY